MIESYVVENYEGRVDAPEQYRAAGYREERGQQRYINDRYKEFSRVGRKIIANTYTGFRKDPRESDTGPGDG